MNTDTTDVPDMPANARWALIRTHNHAEVAAYLPANYQIAGMSDDGTVIVGADQAGWTLDSYVLPRLASGLLFGEELSEPPVFWAPRGGR